MRDEYANVPQYVTCLLVCMYIYNTILYYNGVMTSHTWLWRWYIIAERRVSASEARLRITSYSLCIMYLQWFPLLCSISSAGVPQPVDWLSP